VREGSGTGKGGMREGGDGRVRERRGRGGGRLRRGVREGRGEKEA